jgi:hypothetical protein
LGRGKITVSKEAAMSENTLQETEPVEIPLAQIGHQHESLRIIRAFSDLKTESRRGGKKERQERGNSRQRK